MSMLHNIEIKVRHNDLSIVEQKLHTLNAEFIGVDYQTDKYYAVKEGRLKIRNGNIENNLIYYKRKENQALKESEVILIPLDANTKSIESVLDNILECYAMVKKKRKIFFIENTKFHLDEVDNLGNFVEIEVIDRNGSKSKEELKKICEYYIDELGLRDDEFVPVSYCDMLNDSGE